MKTEIYLDQINVTLSELPAHLQQASHKLNEIISTWTGMKNGQKKKLVRDLILKSDDEVTRLVKDWYDQAPKDELRRNRLLKMEAIYLRK